MRTLLYDADCGFCRTMVAGVLALDRRRSIRPVTIQSERGAELLAGVPERERLASWHFVDDDGELSSGGDAFAPLLRGLPGLRPAGAALARLPRVTRWGYRAVASRRNTIGPRLPQRLKRRADEAIARRGPPSAS